MSFCVECGATVKTISGLCPKCYMERHELISPPDALDVVKCVQCSKMQIGRAWVETDIDGALLRLFEKSVPTSKEVTFRTFTFDARPEDKSNFRVAVKAMLRVDGVDFVKSFRTRLRVHGGSCPSCGKRAGFYYESILQVRAEDRHLSPEEMDEVTQLVQDLVDRAASRGEAFISKIEPVRGGVDLYLSSHNLGRNIAKEIRSKYGGSVSVSPSLYGMKDGKEIYRTTHLVRLPRFKEGDVIRLDGRLFEVLRLGMQPSLRDLRTGESASADPTRLERAKIVFSERFVADVLSVNEKDVEYYDVLESTNAKAPRPPKFGEPNEVEIVKTDEGSFVSMFRRAGARKSR